MLLDLIRVDEEFLTADGWKKQPAVISDRPFNSRFFKQYHTPSRCAHNPESPIAMELSRTVVEVPTLNPLPYYRLVLRAAVSDYFQVSYEVSSDGFTGRLEDFIRAYDTFLLGLWERSVFAYSNTRPGGVDDRTRLLVENADQRTS